MSAVLDALACGDGGCPCLVAARRGAGLTHCPGPGHANSDRDPSLSVTDRDGKLLVSCKAGCTNEQVIEALRGRGLWGAPHRPERREVARYEYVDRDGTLLYRVIRYEPKAFVQQLADGSWKLGDVRRVLYRLPEVIAAVERGEVVYIAEGEKDVDVLVRLGTTATCNVGGAGKWLDAYASDLIGATVVIVADRDDAGRKHAKDVAQKLSVVAKGVKVIELPGDHVKDAADWISAGGTLDQLREIIARTPEWDSGDARVIMTARELAEEYWGVLERRKAQDPDEIGWATGFADLDIIPVRYRPGDLWLIVSATGVGKTTFLLTLQQQATAGTMFVTMEQPRVQLMDRMVSAMTKIRSTALTKGELTDANFSVISAALGRLVERDDRLFVDQPNLTTDALDPLVRVARARFGARIVFVDYAQRMADRIGESEYQRVTRISNNLARIARETATCIVAAAQVSRKYSPSRGGTKEAPTEGEPPRLTDIRDSGYLEQDASVVLAIGRAEGSSATKIAVRKNRHGLTGPVIDLFFDGTYNRFVAAQKSRVAEVEDERPYL